MLSVWVYAIMSVILVSLVSLIGAITLSVDEERLRRGVSFMVSLAAGAMFGDAFIHLIPESLEKGGVHKAVASLLILAGIFAFFILDKFLQWRHEHSLSRYKSVGYINLFSDGLHNLIDGLLIGSSYLVNTEVGVSTTVAVFLHEIPQEIGDFGVLLHAGWSKTRALVFNFLSASLAVLGTIIALLASTHAERFSTLMLPFAAGSFIYIAGSDLVPELHKESGPWKTAIQLLAMSAGAGLMLFLTVLE